MASMYINQYRPWPAWVVTSNEEIARKFACQIGTYRGHADRDPGHDMSGDLAADFFFYDNTKAKHDELLAWFKKNAKRLGATYIITWRRIWSVARADEGTRAYAGTDPHTGHVHISYGTKAPPGRDDDDMPLNDADKAWIKATINAATPSAGEIADAVLTRDNKIKNITKREGAGTHVSLASSQEEIMKQGQKP